MRQQLLAWYDRYGRDLPWRSKGSQRPDPYHIWLSEVMLQQTTVQAVIPYFVKFVDKWPTIHNLADADDDDLMQAWAGLGYYARARNLLKCARVISREYNGRFPQDIETLKTLPGIGDYTAAAISAIAFDQVATVIDGNVERVISRYCAIEDPLPQSKPQIRAHADPFFQGPRPGDFAQAMMDLGATVCIPKSPRCGVCPIESACQGRIKGVAVTLPRKAPKIERPRRKGFVYCIFNKKGHILLERRPEKGLLGGMMGLPTSDWVDISAGQGIDHSFDIDQFDNVMMNKDFVVRHVFTHFSLSLQGVVLVGGNHDLVTDDRRWVTMPEALEMGLPTLFKKAIRMVEGIGIKV